MVFLVLCSTFSLALSLNLVLVVLRYSTIASGAGALLAVGWGLQVRKWGVVELEGPEGGAHGQGIICDGEGKR